MIWYLLPIFLAAFLLFQVQPLIAKHVLPWYGGSPSVWTVCMLFYQTLLLAGYAYAHWLAGWQDGRRRQGQLHGLLLGAALLILLGQWVFWGTPLLPEASWKPEGDESPTRSILLLLCVSIGIPYLVLGATSPLLQRWYSFEYPGRSPYRLFSLSNLGSLLALVTFPFVFEAYLDLSSNAWIWFLLFLLFGAACAYTALRVRRPVKFEEIEDEASRQETPDALSSKQNLEFSKGTAILCFLAAASAATLLLAVTNHLCQEIAVVPLLWVLPLSLYLLSFILCFGHASWYRRRVYLPLFLTLAALAWMALFQAGDLDLRVELVIFSLLLFSGCMICHGELHRLRPHPKSLTGYYLTIAGGGAFGGFFVSVMAPMLFSGFWELPIGMFVIWVLVGAFFLRGGGEVVQPGFQWCAYGFIGVFMYFLADRLAGALPILASGEPIWGLRVETIALTAILTTITVLVLLPLPPENPFNLRSFVWPRVSLFTLLLFQLAASVVLVQLDQRGALERVRNFYGTLKVTQREPSGAETSYAVHSLIHGRTIHGLQSLDPEQKNVPTAYYGRSSGVGLVLRDSRFGVTLRVQDEPRRIGVVGLGVGTLAAYGESRDELRFYEINPEVIRLAMQENHFTYLSDTPAKVELSLGDARLSLERELRESGSQGFDVLVLDAFTSDAIPVHLLTREALSLYLEHLRRPNGILAFHISNRYLDLRPLLASLADDDGLVGRWIEDRIRGDGLQVTSSWVLLGTEESVFEPIDAELPEESRLGPDRRVPSWTDSFSNLFQVIR